MENLGDLRTGSQFRLLPMRFTPVLKRTEKRANEFTVIITNNNY